MKSAGAAILCLAIVGCAGQSQSNYYASIAAIPLPANDTERSVICGNLRQEIARQQNIAMMAPANPGGVDMRPLIIATARQHIAALEQKASDCRCNAAFSSAPAPAPPPPREAPAPNFDACFERCRSVTDRTKEQCFDACNR